MGGRGAALFGRNTRPHQRICVVPQRPSEAGDGQFLSVQGIARGEVRHQARVYQREHPVRPSGRTGTHQGDLYPRGTGNAPEAA